MEKPNICSKCGAEISSEGGLCPICLFESSAPTGLKTDSDAPISSSPQISTEHTWESIGGYRLLQKIGEGGFGVVYLAEQKEPRRLVAVKVIKLGMATKEVVARFEAERQALALMDHPSIAKVMDAGATETGRPFFAMELVRGINIRDYCDKHDLSTEERLKLFAQVCQAIQHAHQKGIIHRDLKPSNILISLLDGVPVPKVIDFGIAKATAGRLTDKPLVTEWHQFMGTAAYMSPEQAEMTGLDIDTRSDIYSLGVVLYELLTGRTPFDSEELMKLDLDEMRQTIREKDPPKPSTRLSKLAPEELSVVAKNRQCAPQALNKLVRGELDWIVMKALEKDRTRRYDSASAFARDIQRYLQHEPISAAAPSTLYRLQKFARRHRVAFASATAMAALLLAGAIISTWMGIQASQAGKIARAEANKSRQVAQFLKNMLSSVGPSVSLGRDTKMLREILDKTAEDIGKELNGQPGLEAELRTIVGQVYADLGEYGKAETMFSEALRLRRELWRNEHREVADSLKNLAYVLKARGNLDEAGKMFEAALVMRRKLLGNENTSVATALSHLADVRRLQGRFAEAERMHLEALAIRTTHLGEGSQYVADSFFGLAEVLLSQTNRAGAETNHLKALAIREELWTNGHPAIAASLMALGRVHRSQRKYADAEKNYRDAFEMRRKVLTDEHPDTVRSLTSLTDLLQARGRPGNAETLLTDFLTPAIESQPRSAVLLYLRGNLRGRTARWKEAMNDFSKVVQLNTNEHRSWFRLAPLLLQTSDVAGYLQHCHAVLARFGTNTEPRVAEQAARACLLYPLPGEDLKIASRLADTAVTTDKDQPSLALAESTKGLADYRQGRMASAVEWAKKASAKTGKDDQLAAQCYIILAMAHHQSNASDEARVALDKAVAIVKTKPPKLESGDLTDNWHHWLVSQILLREAKTLVGGEPAASVPAN